MKNFFSSKLRTGFLLTALLAVSFTVFVSKSEAIMSSVPISGTLAANASLSAVIATSSGEYIGGNFTYLGIDAGDLVSVATSTGTITTPFPSVNNSISTEISDGSGGEYIGGAFTQIGSTTQNYVAHILSNNTVDPNFNPNPNSSVSSLALSPDGSTLYIGGVFTTIGSSTYNRLAAINTSNGTASTTFNPSVNATVSAMALSPNGSTLYIGGVFTTISSSTYNHLAAINVSNGTASTTFNPNVNGTVGSLALTSDGSTLYIGGAFTTVSSSTYNHLAAITTSNATVVSAFNPNVNSNVVALALSPDGSTLYTGGTFTTVGGSTYNHLAAITVSNGTASTTFNPNVNGTVGSLALTSDGSTLYAGGIFSAVGSSTYNDLTAITVSNGAAIPGFNPLIGGIVYVQAIIFSSDKSKLYIGLGSGALVNGVSRNYLAHILSNGTVDPNFYPIMGNSVSSMALSPDGSTLYVGGSFTTIGSSTYNRLAAITVSNGAASTTFNPNVNGSVASLALTSDGSTLYIGGGFTTIGSSTYNRLAAITVSNGSPSTTFNPNVNGVVSSLTLSPDGSTLYIGGTFTTIGISTYNYLAAINTSNGTASTTFNPNLNNFVSTLLLSPDGSTLYVGGSFTTIGSSTYNHLAGRRGISDRSQKLW